MTAVSLGTPAQPAFSERIWRINWGLVLVLTAIAGIGVVALYSAAGGRFDPWAARHAMRYGAALLVLLVVALIHPKVWLWAAWPIYGAAMLLLVAVDVAGKTGMGAQRWLQLGPMQIQPSEIAKVAVILVLARYYQGLTQQQAARLLYAVPPLLVILAPVGLVMVQPDLGTVLVIACIVFGIVSVGGARARTASAATFADVGNTFGNSDRTASDCTRPSSRSRDAAMSSTADSVARMTPKTIAATLAAVRAMGARSRDLQQLLHLLDHLRRLDRLGDVRVRAERHRALAIGLVGRKAVTPMEGVAGPLKVGQTVHRGRAIDEVRCPAHVPHDRGDRRPDLLSSDHVVQNGLQLES